MQFANVIAHSEYKGKEIITVHARCWRPIHSENLTHKMIGKSAGSSRARPSAAIIEQVRHDPWMPVRFGANQPGMQDKGTNHEEPCFYDLGSGNSPLPFQTAEGLWQFAAIQAAKGAEALNNAGYHKQVVNRLLEPFTYIDVLFTATEWNNYFHLRDHEDADPSLRDIAVKIRDAITKSTPTMLSVGEWHLPFITDEDREWAIAHLQKGRLTRDMPKRTEVNDLLVKISAARCARISYKLFDGTTDQLKDLDLFERLLVSQPVHASPAEHQATPMAIPSIVHLKDGWDNFHPDTWQEGITHVDKYGKFWSANLQGWVQHRKLIPNEFLPN